MSPTLFNRHMLACAAALAFYVLASLGASAAISQFKIHNPDVGHSTQLLGDAIAVDGNTLIAGAQKTSTRVGQSGTARVYHPDGLGGWALEAELMPIDPGVDDLFGISVAISGDTAVVGADAASAGFVSSAGAAYVFTRSGGVWTQQARLTASDPANSDNFGHSVAIVGDTIMVGAPDAKVGSFFSGKVYIFTRTGGVWSEQTKLTAADATSIVAFGNSLASTGTTLLIGSPKNNASGTASGAAYVFTGAGATWTQQAKLIASDGTAGDQLGTSVAITSDTVVLGAPQDNAVGTGAGSAYVFTRSGSTWTQQARLNSTDHSSGANFGSSVSVNADTAIVGAMRDSTGAADSGSAYVFTRTGATWTQQARLNSLVVSSADEFGTAVAVLGDTTIIGEPLDGNPFDTGSVSVFTRSGATWTRAATLTDAFSASSDDFGYAVALSGDTAVIGAYGDKDGTGGSGSAYVFVRSGSDWVMQARLVENLPPTQYSYGYAVAVSGDTVLIGMPAISTSNSNPGSVYVYTRTAGVWSKQAQLTPADGADDDGFGASVSLAGDTALIGAYQDDDGGHDSGSAYVFTRSGTTWSQQTKLNADDAAAGDNFGFSVALANETALIGATNDDDVTTDSGSAYVFTRSGSTWSKQAKLTASDPGRFNHFGTSVAIAGDIAVAGAPYDDKNTTNTDTGSAYIYNRTGSSWAQNAKLTASDPRSSDLFGSAVSVSGSTALVGATGNPGLRDGSVYLFNRSGATWVPQPKVIDKTLDAGFGYGAWTSLDGDRALVGSIYDDDPEADSGSALVITLRENSAGNWSLYH